MNRRKRTLGIFAGAAMALAALTVSSVVVAQNPDGGVRYNRKSKKTKAKSGLLDTKFKEAKKQEEKNRKRGVDMMGGDDFVKKRKAVEQEMADKQITMLKNLIKTTDKGDPERPDFLFRLADHHLEKKAYFDQQADELFDPIWEAEDAGNKSKVKQLQQKQDRHRADGKKASEAAARVYEALVTDPTYQSYKRMDEALYYYAFELGSLGREEKMKDAYKRLITNYPDSPFISQAYLAFADYYYNNQEIQAAVRLYEKVLQFKDSPVYAYALYKLGWCHLNPIGTAEPRYDTSLNYFIKTIQATKEGRAGSEAAGKQLRRDARRDLVRAYVRASKPSKAWDFFEKWGVGPGKDENDARKMMELLANQYFGDGQYTESTFIYKKLQDLFEGADATCEWQSRIVVNTLATDNKEIQWKETKRLGEFWTEYKDSNKKKTVKKKCRDDALDTMKQMATVWHDEAEKTKLDRTYELAELAYGDFLQVFPKDKDAYELQYYYAELLWALATNNYNQKDDASKEKGKEYFSKAHTEFVKALELDPKGKFTTDAAFGQMLAMKNALEYDETGGKSKACKTNSEGVCVYKEKKTKKKKRDQNSKADASAEYPESDYTEDESKMLSAYDIYTKYVKDKDDKELPKIMYHRAKLAMIHNKFDTARPLLEDLVTKFDGTVYAAWSSEMLVDLLTIRWIDKNNTTEQGIKASEDLEEWASKLQKMKVWKHPEADQIREAVPRLLQGIGWKKGMLYKDAGARYVKGEPDGDPEGFLKCRDQFVQVYNDYADHEKADTLLWNAAECSDAAYSVGNSIKLRKILLERHEDSKHAQDTLHYLAGSYQAVAYYADAATRYEEFAEKYEKKDKTRTSEALQNAYLYRLGLGEEEKATENLEKYENLYKKKEPKKAAKIFWSKHALLKTDKERKKHAEEYLKKYGSKGGVDRQVVAEAVIGQVLWRESCEEELLYDSCITVKRKRALSAAREIEKRKRMEKRLARKKGKNKEEKSKKYKAPKYCGSDTKGIITVRRRDKKDAAAAQARFKKVAKLVKKKIEIPAEETERAEEFKNAWAMSLVYMNDQEYEEYLKLKMPDDLEFNVEEWRKDSGIPSWERKYAAQVKKRDESIAAFKEYNEKKMNLAGKLGEGYKAVESTGSPGWILASAARRATILQNYADQLYRAPVPESIKTEEQYYGYCDQLSDYAVPLEQKAVELFTYCIDKSTQYQFFNTFSRMCEDEMQQSDAEKYPATNETFGSSIYTDSRIEMADVFKVPSDSPTNPLLSKQGSDKAEGEEKEEGEE